MKGQLYESEDGFRWRLKSGNNKTMADSGEAYTTEQKAQDAFDKCFNGQHPLELTGGEVIPAQVEVTEVTNGELVGAGARGLGGLPDDPSHPLYSPLAVDGNKV